MKARKAWISVVAAVLVGAGLIAGRAALGWKGRGDSGMAPVSASDFRRGTVESPSGFPKGISGKKPLHPVDVLTARAGDGWRPSDERPARTVTLSAYAIDRTEVTNRQYREFVEWFERKGSHRYCHPDEPPGKNHAPRYWGDFNPLLKDPGYARTAPFSAETFKGDEEPVVGVDWYDAYAYAHWRGKRLPTEAEWERACGDKAGWRWPWGNEWRWGYANVGGETVGFDSDSNLKKDGYAYMAPAGRFPQGRSGSGCDDMAGNVAEWVADRYGADYYEVAPSENPRGPESGNERVVRGGSFRSYPSAVRCAARAHYEPEFRSFAIGFRCARED